MTSLRAKLAVGFGGLLLILLIVSLLSMVVLTRYSHTLERVFRENYDSAIYCDQMKAALDALDARAQAIAWGDSDSSFQVDPTKRKQQFETNLNLQLANCTLPGELERTRQLASIWANYRGAYEQFDAAPADSRDLYRRVLTSATSVGEARRRATSRHEHDKHGFGGWASEADTDWRETCAAYAGPRRHPSGSNTRCYRWRHDPSAPSNVDAVGSTDRQRKPRSAYARAIARRGRTID